MTDSPAGSISSGIPARYLWNDFGTGIRSPNAPLFFVLGIVFCVLIVAVAGVVGYVAHRARASTPRARPTSIRRLSILVRTGIRRNFSNARLPICSESVARADRRLFQQLRRFGHLVHYDGAKGQANMSVMFGSGSRTSAVTKPARRSKMVSLSFALTFQSTMNDG